MCISLSCHHFIIDNGYRVLNHIKDRKFLLKFKCFYFYDYW